MIELVMESLMYYLAGPRKQRCHPKLWLSTAICRTTVEWALALLSSVSMFKFMTVQSTTYPLGSKTSLSKGLGTPIFPLKKPGDIKTYFWDVRRRMYAELTTWLRNSKSRIYSHVTAKANHTCATLIHATEVRRIKTSHTIYVNLQYII